MLHLGIIASIEKATSWMLSFVIMDGEENKQKME